MSDSDSVDFRDALTKLQQYLLMQHNYLPADLEAIFNFEAFLDKNKLAVEFLENLGLGWEIPKKKDRELAISLPIPTEIGGPSDNMLAEPIGSEFDKLLGKAIGSDAFEFTVDESPAAAEMQQLALPVALQEEEFEPEVEFNLEAKSADKLASGFEVADDGDTDTDTDVYSLGDLGGYVEAVKTKAKSWFASEPTDAYNDGILVGEHTEGDDFIGEVKGKYEKKEKPSYFYGGSNSSSFFSPPAKRSAYAEGYDRIWGEKSGESHDTFRLADLEGNRANNSTGSSNPSNTGGINSNAILFDGNALVGCGDPVSIGNWIIVKKLYPEIKTNGTGESLAAIETFDFNSEPVKVIAFGENNTIAVQAHMNGPIQRFSYATKYFEYKFSVVPDPFAADENEDASNIQTIT